MRKENFNQKSVRYTGARIGYTKRSNWANALLLFLAVLNLSSYAKSKEKPLMIREQGSFAVGGTVITNPGTFNQYKIGRAHV